MTRVTKAVFPVAGFGTRFLPATKAQPKVMMPLVDKPLIQYAVEEALAAGITELVFVTGRHKRAVDDHFDKAYELEAELAAAGKHALLAAVRGVLPSQASCIHIRQVEMRGLGHAVLCARPVIGDAPFAVLLADDVMFGEAGAAPVLAQMIERHDYESCSIVAVEQVPAARTAEYGIVGTRPYADRTALIDTIVEKPLPHAAPSTLAVVGRYVLSPRIFAELARLEAAGGRVELSDALANLLFHERVLAYRFAGRRYDCGTKAGFLQASVDAALRHPEIAAPFAQWLAARA